MKKLLALILILCALCAVVLAEEPQYAGEATLPLGEPQFFMELPEDRDIYYGELDELGRVTGVTALIGPTNVTGRVGISNIYPTGFQSTTYKFIPGLNLYQRCHLIAHALGGSENAVNLFTGTQYININAMKPIEDNVAAYIRQTGNHVRYECVPWFVDEELVCRGVFLSAQSVEDNRISFCVFCYNVQPGVAIDYENGYSILAETSAKIDAPVSRAMPGESEEQHYILNTGRRRFHYPWCPSVTEMSSKNRQDYYGTREELIEMGYTSCGSCNP
jgi:DNA-entry nuclease